jgi:hypothetical protein
MKNVVCMKWGAKFPPSYVNTLASMVGRHLPQPYRFICFTDDGSGLDKKIEVRPLPDVPEMERQLDGTLPERGWRKLTVLGSNLGGGLSGDALFLDLDVIVLDSLEPFFTESGKFIIIKDWNLSDAVIGNSSVFRFEIGQHQDVLDYFLSDGDSVRREHRNEQAYLSYSMYRKGILTYWQPEWCRSFKRHCLRSFPLCYFAEPKRPARAKIVIFHGNPNPDAVQRGWTGHYGLRAARPAEWITKNWQ